MNHKFQDALWGFIVGDALGVPYEFKSREEIRNNPAVDMVGYGTYHQPPGTWSDDTSMMLCVLQNIIQDGNTKQLADLFLQWYRDDYMTPHGALFDIGITTSTALSNIMNGLTPSESGLNHELSAGNGSLMRCLPYAFVQDIRKSIFQMTFDSRITHRNELCNLCCIYYVKMVRAILDGKDKHAAMKEAAAYLHFGWRITDEEEEHAAVKLKFSRLFSQDFSALDMQEIKSTGYVLYTLEAVVWCFLNSNDYKSAVLKAVNLGDDTDTIAALTGGLAGLYYGYDNIPKHWLSQIANPDLIINLLNQTDLTSKYLVRKK